MIKPYVEMVIKHCNGNFKSCLIIKGTFLVFNYEIWLSSSFDMMKYVFINSVLCTSKIIENELFEKPSVTIATVGIGLQQYYVVLIQDQ
jgi:hypothetical protein